VEDKGKKSLTVQKGKEDFNFDLRENLIQGNLI